jgi:hypothetical protein
VSLWKLELRVVDKIEEMKFPKPDKVQQRSTSLPHPIETEAA